MSEIDNLSNSTGAKPPLNLTRLSFDSFEQWQAYKKKYSKWLDQIWRWHGTIGNRAEDFALPGLCEICERQTSFASRSKKAPEGGPFEYEVDWWNTLCGCGMPTLDRSVIHFLLEGVSGRQAKIYHVGQYSLLARWIAENCQDVTLSQFEEGRRPGEIANGVRYETLTELSFDDNTFDALACTEILEHIPDYKLAMREMARVLAPGGLALLTFPWLGGDHYEHRVRAEMQPDGTIVHFLPPEYHGDPAKKEGILSFRAFGWKVLDELREAGFASVSANFLFGPLHGYMSVLNPVLVAVK